MSEYAVRDLFARLAARCVITDEAATSPPLPFVGAAGTPSESDAEMRADWAADADREEQER